MLFIAAEPYIKNIVYAWSYVIYSWLLYVKKHVKYIIYETVFHRVCCKP